MPTTPENYLKFYLILSENIRFRDEIEALVPEQLVFLDV